MVDFFNLTPLLQGSRVSTRSLSRHKVACTLRALRASDELATCDVNSQRARFPKFISCIVCVYTYTYITIRVKVLNTIIVTAPGSQQRVDREQITNLV